MDKALFYKILSKGGNANDVIELDRLIKTYPYFPLAHLFRAGITRAETDINSAALRMYDRSLLKERLKLVEEEDEETDIFAKVNQQHTGSAESKSVGYVIAEATSGSNGLDNQAAKEASLETSHQNTVENIPSTSQVSLENTESSDLRHQNAETSHQNTVEDVPSESQVSLENTESLDLSHQAAETSHQNAVEDVPSESQVSLENTESSDLSHQIAETSHQNTVKDVQRKYGVFRFKPSNS
ncbi:MAG: hypothetical protein EAZ67_04140 [Cytophagales bacterium]|nr:MAG: hypothetical protein EAZ67_04140 [Cytophagales bacterium]